MHWVDYYVENNLLKKRNKEEFGVESGITPSGFVHIGNFRELFTTFLIAHALKEKGKKVRLIHVWDDYDRFRKVPRNIPEEFKKYLGMPVSEVPDPWGCHKSYAEHFIDKFEKEIKEIGIEVEFIKASEMYKSGKYAEKIRIALNNTEKIKEILNKYRKEPLDDNWLPIIVYCPKCRKEGEAFDWDGEKVKFKCGNCGYEGFEKPENGNIKLRWRVDWPMRWSYLKIDFEPGGKDHLAAGSSYDTGKLISKEIFNWEAPETLMYEFVRIKGEKGKMSGSKGNVILLSDLLEVLEPGVIRFIYTRTKPNKEIHIDMGLGLLNLYDEFDKAERIYFGKDEGRNEEETEELKRSYELSMPELPEKLPLQVPFRHLVVLVQLPGMNEEKIIKKLKEQNHLPENVDENELERIKIRIKKAQKWVEKYAPDMVKFKVLEELPKIEVNEEIKDALKEIVNYLEKNEIRTKEEILKFEEFIYNSAKKRNINSKDFFKTIYLLFIGKERGPRLANFLASLDKDFTIKRLRLEG